MQLAYPWFLFGLFAVIVPVVIHLLQLRRPQRVLFTNTAFIREVEMVTVRHRQLQHWFVLLVRALAIAALVFVFCQPFIPAERYNDLMAQSSTMDVWVDNSNSMQVRAISGRSLLEEGMDQAAILGKGNKADKFRLLNIGRKIESYTQYENDLNTLKLGQGNSAFASISADRNSLVYLFSDFQKSAFTVSSLDKFGSSKRVVLVPLAGKRVGNIYVDSVWVDDAFVRLHTNIGLHVRLRNGGQTDVTDCQVKVLLGAKQAAALRVTVAPGKAVTTVVQVQIDNSVPVEGRVVVDDLPVAFDNTYYFTLQPAAAIRVLEIGEEPVTQQLYGNEPLFAYTFAKSGRVDFGLLRRANMILVSGIANVDAGLREALVSAVKQGASVVIVPSAASGAHTTYNLLFKELGLGGVQWEDNAPKPELREVAMPSAQEPFFRDVFGAQQRAVTMPRVAPVLRWSRTGTDIMRLRDGESYLAGFTNGAGQVYVFSAPFGTAYSDFVEHALFVPVMYRMAMLSYQNEQLPAYRLNQDVVTLKLPAAGTAGRQDEAAFRMVKDSLILIPAQRVVGSEVRLELPEAMNVPGFYQVRQGQQPLTTLAFNANKRESELEAYSADDLRQLLGNSHPNVRVVENGANGAGLAADSADQTGTPLWRYFLAATLVFLLAEALLVRFGRPRAAVGSGSVAAKATV
ncbi:BatA domain-containing protein [Hymenobacter sp. M29]|uniref:BatA domain-containing protein n=1 Tax=Hymenobacter mellowenesis TaxID=3063995 RepID=A0ABT9ADT7_9BACT|nr:BatA domain-containing protein [Hymenobacter sp. M29]MDO7847990.1 BatA domain-containing protein [Hymenobacter sp. M29]